eukprot:scaffold31514_cov114-Isochrysis_galbana.AAC.4
MINDQHQHVPTTAEARARALGAGSVSTLDTCARAHGRTKTGRVLRRQRSGEMHIDVRMSYVDT